MIMTSKIRLRRIPQMAAMSVVALLVMQTAALASVSLSNTSYQPCTWVYFHNGAEPVAGFNESVSTGHSQITVNSSTNYADAGVICQLHSQNASAAKIQVTRHYWVYGSSVTCSWGLGLNLGDGSTTISFTCQSVSGGINLSITNQCSKSTGLFKCEQDTGTKYFYADPGMSFNQYCRGLTAALYDSTGNGYSFDVARRCTSF